ncbi:MAG: RusA family crossover junction endodeoxyribonuclease [Treponema sp.]|jgi:predicted amidophosphoribosyltransferase|nr:RusA family crossover junction endodeoxyribonuclease [Treponema sp.]
MKRKSPTFTETIICQNCGIEAQKHGVTQKYCEKCSIAKDVERKALWAKKNPIILTNEQIKVNREKAKSRNIARGLVNNKSTVKNISVFPDVNLWWQVTIAIPFSYSGSKNHLWSTTGKGHVYRRGESNAMQEQIALMLKCALSGKKIYRNKIWIDIYVQKPDHRGDAINFVDLIADAIKTSVGIDDRWFSIRRLDWQIVKENPRIFIGIGQEATFDAKICSYCGRILPEEMFGKSKRECKECTSEKGHLTALANRKKENEGMQIKVSEEKA